MNRSMYQLLATHLWQTIFRNRAVWGLFLLMGVAALYAGWAGWARLRQQEFTQAQYQQQARQDWLSNPDKHPHRMAHYGNFAFRTRSPLSLFDSGMDSFLGNALYLEAHKQNTVNFSEAGFSTGLLRFGDLSLAMLLQVLLPLLIFFLGAGSVATDRENGTLKLLLSQGVGWRTLLIGKSAGLFAVSLTLYVPLLLLAGGLWLAAQRGVPTADEGLRLGLLALFYALYLALFCGLAVLVSAWSRTTKTALVSLIGIWLMLTIVLPRALQALGSSVYALPSKTEFQEGIEADISKEGDSHNPNDAHYRALKDSVLVAYGVGSVEQLPFNYSGFQMSEGEKISATIYNEHYQELLALFDRQNQFARAMAFLNPYLTIRNLSMALSGTDFSGYIDFQEQAETYRYGMAQKMNELQMKYISNQKPGPADKPHAIDRHHWEDMPDFQYRSQPISAALEGEWLSMAAFGFWLVGLLFLIRRAAVRLTAV